jgi:hypothetical protein
VARGGLMLIGEADKAIARRANSENLYSVEGKYIFVLCNPQFFECNHVTLVVESRPSWKYTSPSPPTRQGGPNYRLLNVGYGAATGLRTEPCPSE